MPAFLHRQFGARFVYASMIMVLSSGQGYAADAPSEQTPIRNVATGTYQSGGSAPSIQSNAVEQAWDQLIDVSVKALAPAPVPASARLTTLPFKLTNKGNFGSPFLLTVAQMSRRNRTDVLVDSIYVDANGDGKFEPDLDTRLGERGLTRDIAAGEQVAVFVQAALTPESLDGDTVQFQLNAASALATGAPGSVFEAATGAPVRRRLVMGNSKGQAADLASIIVQTAQVKLLKAQIVVDPYGGKAMVPGAIITYSIRVQTTGSGTAEQVRIADLVPNGTSYIPGTLRLNGNSLSDGADTDQGVASQTGIDVLLGDIKGGTADRTVSFQVRVNGLAQ